MSSDSDSDKIPIRKSTTPIHGVPIVSPIDDVNDRLDHLLIKVDRLSQTNKLLKWVANAAIIFALGSAIAVARMLYGLGADDATFKAAVDRVQRQADENKADIRELTRYLYRRYTGSSDNSPPTPKE